MIGIEIKLCHARVETVHGFFFDCLGINFYGIAYIYLVKKVSKVVYDILGSW